MADFWKTDALVMNFILSFAKQIKIKTDTLLRLKICAQDYCTEVKPIEVPNQFFTAAV